MTLQEAIKSGKPFKRQRWFNSSYIKVLKVGTVEEFKFLSNNAPFIPIVEDVIAADYELKSDEPEYITASCLIGSSVGPRMLRFEHDKFGQDCQLAESTGQERVRLIDERLVEKLLEELESIRAKSSGLYGVPSLTILAGNAIDLYRKYVPKKGGV